MTEHATDLAFPEADARRVVTGALGAPFLLWLLATADPGERT